MNTKTTPSTYKGYQLMGNDGTVHYTYDLKPPNYVAMATLDYWDKAKPDLAPHKIEEADVPMCYFCSEAKPEMEIG